MPPSSLYGSQQSADYPARLRNAITYLLNIVRDNPHQRLPKASTRDKKRACKHIVLCFYTRTQNMNLNNVSWNLLLKKKKKCTSTFEMSLLFIDYTSKANIIFTLFLFFDRNVLPVTSPHTCTIIICKFSQTKKKL